MGLSVTTTIFLFVVCLCGGIAIGAMFNRYKKAPPEEAETKKQPEEEPAAGEKSIAGPGDKAVLRAWRNEADRVWLEMDGLRLETKDDLGAEQKKNLLKLVLELRPWLDAVPAPTPAPAPRPPVQEPQAVQELLPAEEPPVKPLKLFQRPPKEKKPAAEAKPAVSMKSIVEQIDDVLQVKLTGSPFANLKIRLLEGPGGEVNVQIGAVKHPSVEAIPNPEIQAVIRQAVADWEKGSK